MTPKRKVQRKPEIEEIAGGQECRLCIDRGLLLCAARCCECDCHEPKPTKKPKPKHRMAV